MVCNKRKSNFVVERAHPRIGCREQMSPMREMLAWEGRNGWRDGMDGRNVSLLSCSSTNKRDMMCCFGKTEVTKGGSWGCVLILENSCLCERASRRQLARTFEVDEAVLQNLDPKMPFNRMRSQDSLVTGATWAVRPFIRGPNQAPKVSTREPCPLRGGTWG